MNDLELSSSIFESIKHIDEFGNEYWSARELSKALKYTDWRNFLKVLRYREDILDNMGSDELIANLFRISQTEQKLRKDNVKIENEANKVHYNIGKNIRDVISR